MTVRILIADVREKLAELPDESVHCVVTSPPYWGLRDYGAKAQIWGGDPGCDHEWGDLLPPKPGPGNKPGDFSTSSLTNPKRQNELERGSDGGAFCQKCSAWRGQLGLEPTIDLYVQHMVEVFREVRRVLRKDGTLWLNMGDCYCNAGSSRNGEGLDGKRRGGATGPEGVCGYKKRDIRYALREQGIKHKDLVGQPWRVAFALQADGWWLRSDIIWAKPNPMPESCRDRPTKSHEYVFMLTKAAKYFFDQEAVRESVTGNAHARRQDGERSPRYMDDMGGHNKRAGLIETYVPSARNIRSVWTIATQAFPEAHFATFPERLPERCIRAGTSERGCCPQCGAPWVRVVEKAANIHPGSSHDHTADLAQGNTQTRADGKPAGTVIRERCSTKAPGIQDTKDTKMPEGWATGLGAHGNEKRRLPKHPRGDQTSGSGRIALGVARARKAGGEHDNPFAPRVTTGWRPSCKHKGEPVPCTVLDPFIGSGTTALVGVKLGRSVIGIELSEEYAGIARRRLEREVPLLAGLEAKE